MGPRRWLRRRRRTARAPFRGLPDAVGRDDEHVPHVPRGEVVSEERRGDGPRPELERAVWAALASVPDPEIPPCSITDLGIVERIQVSDEAVEVELLPTFAGCPALDVIREDAEAAVRATAGDRAV